MSNSVFSIDFNKLSKRPDLANLVVRKGAILIKNASNLEQVHSFISQFAQYNNLCPTWAHLKDLPGTVEVSNIVNPKTKKMGWFQDKHVGWHTNGIFMKEPETCVALFCSMPSKTGGETEIINMRQVYNDLDAKTLHSLQNIQITYKNPLVDMTEFYKFDDFEIAKLVKYAQRSGSEYSRKKNLIYKHPTDGKYGLYFPFTFFGTISDSLIEEEEEILRKLKNLCLLKKYRYIIKWQKNDFLLMDQIHTLHRRNQFKGKRQLFRICFYWKK